MFDAPTTPADAYVRHGSLKVAAELDAFVRDQATPDTGVSAEAFWAGVEGLLADYAPKNRALLARRDELQARLDDWHRAHPGQPDQDAYQSFLREIGYIEAERTDIRAETANVDPEIAAMAGPQLVVPLTNARYLLNAANARWGSLYDALYGTDALGEAPKGGGYDPERGARVIARARALLDQAAPLAEGGHAEAVEYRVENGRLVVALSGGRTTGLADPAVFVGHAGEAAAPSGVLLRHNGLHLEIVIDRSHVIGRNDPASVADVLVEAALSVIADAEDSVAAVDAEDKRLVYANWLGLPAPIWLTVACLILFGFLLNRTTFGRNTLAIGGNEEAARLAGVPVVRTKIIIFVLSGLVSAAAGIILASRMTSGQPMTSIGYELIVISACVLGGVSLKGGIGKISYVVAGILILGTVENAMNLLNISPFSQYVVRGLILLAAVIFDRYKQKAKRTV